MNIFNKLELMDLTESEETLVSYIKNHTENFIEDSASDIAKSCFISVSTIYRLCKKLDISGLSELKVLVSSSKDDYMKESDNLNYNYPVDKNATQYQITHQLQNVYDQTITSTMNLLDLEELRLSVSKLKKAKMIDVYTSSANIYFAENFKFQMQEIGIYINVPIEEYQQRLSASISDHTHCAIVISFGGRGINVEDIVKHLKKNRTPIILITSTDNDKIIPYATHVLYMSSYEDHYNKISSFATRLSILYILDCIYTCYFKLDYDQNIAHKLNYYEKMTDIKNKKKLE
ncbi:MAG: MurR/RpiR family transcriptional regulator [Erysipelotrichaceae bacterium]|nr:MurR/RpiR family transcriptional regulator [Erysipelotrichaceae bacterium]